MTESFSSGLTPATPRTGNAAGAGIALIGGVVALIGVFLTWASVSASGVSQSQSGLDTLTGGGKTIFFVGVVLALIGGALVAGSRRKLGAALAIIGGIVVAGIGFIGLGRVNEDLDRFAAAGADTSVGFGLWLTIVGGVIALIGGVFGLAKKG